MSRQVLSVIGQGGDAPASLVSTALEVGQLAVDAGFRVATGGLGGVMEAACQGARRSQRYQEGDTLGILPGLDRMAANPFVDVVIPTGAGPARNLMVVATASVVVAIGGGAGTLSELALAWQLGRPIIALEGEGWSGKLAGSSIDARRVDVVHLARSAEEAVNLAVSLVYSK